MIRTLYICVNIELDAANYVYTGIISYILKLLRIIHVISSHRNCHYFSNYICGTNNCICIPHFTLRIYKREISASVRELKTDYLLTTWRIPELWLCHISFTISLSIHKTNRNDIDSHETIDASEAIKTRHRIVLRSSFTFRDAVITPAEELSKLLMSGNKRNTRSYTRCTATSRSIYV